MARFDTRDLGSWEQDVATLAGSLVHEVKNPLSTLSITAQLLLEEFSQPATQREHRVVKRLEVMVAEVGRVEEIVNTFLRFTQPQALRATPARINDLIANICRSDAEALERKGIQLRSQLDDAIPLLDLDVGLVHQALLNLVRNAEQAMQDGGDLILRTHLRGSQAEIEIIDTGKGMTEDQLPRIFEPYFSSKPGGTGLGLSITLRIIRAHGGSLSVESEKGKGSRFIVTLPVPPAGAGDSGRKRKP